MIETDRIYLMDCMEGMKQIADGSVDAIIADLPYGVLNRSNPSANWDRQDTVNSLVGAIPADYQAGQPHYPVRAGAFLRMAHAVATPAMAVQPRVAERSGDGTSQCQTYAAPAARGYSGIL